MFIKIKLESQSSHLKNLTYFPFDDDATVISLKHTLEQYVDVSSERLVFRTLSKSFINGQKVREMMSDVEGASIMVYAYDEYSGSVDYEEPNFVCFLQIYKNEMVLRQEQEIDQRSSRTGTINKSTSCSSTSSVTLIADIESDCSSEGSELETASGNSSSESNSEDNSSVDSENSKCSGDGKKRQKTFKNSHCQKKQKSSTVMDRLSPTLCKYLDEFPKCPDEKQPDGIHNNCKSQQNNSPATSSTTVDDNKVPQEDTQELQSEESSSTNKSIVDTVPNRSQSNITSTTTEVSHPCRNINPENRQYIVIISKTGNNITKAQCGQLLDWFFDRFRSYGNSAQLQFENNAVTFFEGKLWIACLNRQTNEWVSSCLSQSQCPFDLESYTFESLNEGKMYTCEVVIPMGSTNTKNLLDIFDLLEKQNTNISTIKWYVSNRRILSQGDKNADAKPVSGFCTNELFTISIDAASKDLLERIDLKLKYCFWQIVFNFVK